MKRVIFSFGKFHVKVSDLLILLLLGFMFMCCQQNTKVRKENKPPKEIMKEEVKQQISGSKTCTFPKENITFIQSLLNRADICSDQWLKELDELIDFLKQQEDTLKQYGTQVDSLYDAQHDLVRCLKALRKDAGKKQVDALKNSFLQYQELAGQLQGGCQR